MTLSIGRKGWTGIGFQTAKDVPATTYEYIPWDTNTLAQMTEQMAVTDAHGLRDSNFSSVPGKQSSKGDLKVLAYPNFVGYLLGAAFGTYNTVNPTAGVYIHTFSVNESNLPQFLSIINNRVVDQEFYPNVAVSALDLQVGIDLATVDTKVVGDIAFQTTSGNFATASGNIWSFKNAQLQVGTTIAAAAAAVPFKTISVKVAIDNGTEALWAHGSVRPYAFAHKDFKVTADIELYFETVADKNAFYAQTKQAAILTIIGNPLGSNTGYNEELVINLPQITYKTFEATTGIDAFQTEKITISGEYSGTSSATASAVLTNSDSNY